MVAFISGIGRITDPWGDLVNYFRDINVTQVKYRLLANAVDQLNPQELHAATPGIDARVPAGIGSAQ